MNKPNSTRLSLLALAVTMTCDSTLAQTGLVLVHGPEGIVDGQQAKEGNSDMFFNPARAAGHFQQVYSSSLFAAVPQGGGFIYGIVFRVDNIRGTAFETDVTGVEIRLSLTDRGPDSLSPVFEENVGRGQTRVLDREQVTHVVAGPSAGTDAGWSIVFSVDPFLYDPAKGNLLMDIRSYRANLGSILDAHRSDGDSVSSVYSVILGGEPDFPPSGIPDTIGLATRFFIDPVPEPSVIGIFTISIVGGIAFARRHTTQGGIDVTR